MDRKSFRLTIWIENLKRLYASLSNRIGYNVTELFAETVTASKLETTYQEALNAIHPHPTISESIKDAVGVAYGEAIHLRFVI